MKLGRHIGRLFIARCRSAVAEDARSLVAGLSDRWQELLVPAADVAVSAAGR